MCSHQVLNVFLLSSQCVPRHVLNSTSLCLICFAQCCPPETYIGGPILGLISLYVWSKYFYIGEILQILQISLGFPNQRGPLAKTNLKFGVPTLIPHPNLVFT